MRLDFKRIMSSVLAFVMLFSSLVMVNVVSVSAAAEEWMATADLPTWLSFSGFTKKTVSSDSLTATFADSIFPGGSNVINNQVGYISSGSGSTFTVKTSAENSELKIYAIRNSSGDTYIKNGKSDIVVTDGTGTASGDIGSGKLVHKRSNLNTPALNITLAGKATYTFKFNSGDVVIYKMILTSEGEDTKPATWTVNTQKNNLTLSEPNKVTVEKSTTLTDTNRLLYSGNDYIVNPTYQNLKKDMEVNGTKVVTYDEASNTYTVEPTMDMFIKTKAFPLANIHFENAGDRFVRFDCENHTDSVHTIYLDGSGNAAGTVVRGADGKADKVPASDGNIYLPQGEKFYVYIAGGTVTLEKPDEGSTNKAEITLSDSTTEIRGTFNAFEQADVTGPSDGAIDLTRDLIMQNDVDQTYLHAGTILGKGNYFEATGNTDFDGDVMLIRDEEGMDSDTDYEHRSNVIAIELKTFDESEHQTNNSIRFHTGELTSENLYVQVMCSSSTDSTADSKIAIRKGSTTDLTQAERVEGMTIPGSYQDNISETITTFRYGPLESNMYYGIYNEGSTATDDNVRLYTVEFLEDTTDTFVDTLDASELDLNEKIDVGDEIYSADNKFQILPNNGSTTSYVQIISRNVKITMPDESQKDITQAIYTNGAGDDSVDKRGVKFKTGDKAGKVYVYAVSNNSETKNAKLRAGSGSPELKVVQAKNTDPIPAAVFEVEANTTYTLYGSGSIFIHYIGSTVPLVSLKEVKTQDVTFTATNNTSSRVTVTITEGKTFEVEANASAKTYPVTGVPEGTYKLSAPGCTITGADITVSDTSKEFTITIDESKNVNVTFDMSDSTKPDADIKITPAGSAAKTISKSDGKAVTFSDVAPGTVFTIDGTPSNVWKWVAKSETATDDGTYSWDKYAESRKYITYDITSKKFTYTLPDAKDIVTGDDSKYGVTFTASSDMATAAGSTTNLYVNTVANDLAFGQYGFGDDKAIENCGNSWARNGSTNYVKFVTTPLSMKDYTNGHYARYYNSLSEDASGRTNRITKTKEVDNQFAVLSQETVTNASNAKNYIEFKVADSAVALNEGQHITVQIDRDNGVDMYDVSASTEKITPSAYVANSDGNKIAKQEFPVEAGRTYRIVANGKTYEGSWTKGQTLETIPSENEKSATAPVMVKSIRMFNPNNVFDGANDQEIAAVDKGNLSDLESSNETLYSKIVEENSGAESTYADAKIYQIIGEINLAGINGITEGNNHSKEELAAAAESIYSVGYDVYDKTEYYNANEKSINYLYHDGITLQGDNVSKPTYKEIEISDVANTAIDLDSNEELEQGSITDGSLSNKIFVQTFYALESGKSVVLVPWVKYNVGGAGSAKVYSLISKADGTSNNHELTN